MDSKFTISELLDRMRQNWPETATPETQVTLSLIRFNDLVLANTNRITAEFGLTPAGFEVLVTLRSLPEPRELSPTELFRAVLITSGGMTKVLKGLEEGGWIERPVSAGDKRAKPVRLTKAGANQAESVMDAVMEGDRNLLSQALNYRDRGVLRKLLLRALEKLE